MEHGFYHPERGYWQTNSAPTPEQLAAYPEGTVEVPLKPSADHEWDGEAWVYVAPPEPTPEELRAALPPLTARQIRLALVQLAQVPLSQVQTALEGLGDESALIEWEYATTFDRMHPLIEVLGGALDLEPEQIDAMWQVALTY